jgi:hypothetical protein
MVGDRHLIRKDSMDMDFDIPTSTVTNYDSHITIELPLFSQTFPEDLDVCINARLDK